MNTEPTAWWELDRDRYLGAAANSTLATTGIAMVALTYTRVPSSVGGVTALLGLVWGIVLAALLRNVVRHGSSGVDLRVVLVGGLVLFVPTVGIYSFAARHGISVAVLAFGAALVAPGTYGTYRSLVADGRV